jgi:Pyruvate/2-oxoacid:ferredoxin oxidoreductase gamma subunit
MVSGAGYVARCNAFDANCVDRLEAALRYPGFSLVDLWELCVAYYVPANHLNRAGLTQLSDQLAMPFGILHEAPPRTTAPQPVSTNGRLKPAGTAEKQDAPSIPWDGRREICIAGSAGQRIRSAAGVIGELAVAGGLFAAQQDDFPITVRKGHSVSNLVLSTQPIRYPAVDEPELLIILSEEGAARLRLNGADLSHALIVAEDGVASPDTRKCLRFDLRAVEKSAGKNAAALAVLAYGLLAADLMEPQTLERAAETSLAGRYRDENLAAIRAGIELFCHSRGQAAQTVQEQS